MRCGPWGFGDVVTRCPAQADGSGAACAGPVPALFASGCQWPRCVPAVGAGAAAPRWRLLGAQGCGAPRDAGG